MASKPNVRETADRKPVAIRNARQTTIKSKKAAGRKGDGAVRFSLDGYVPFLINRLAIALVAYSTPEFESRGLTIPTYRILMALRQIKACSFKELIEKTRIEPPTLSRLLNLLEESRLIRRRKSDVDSRSVMVSLTPAGRAIAARQIQFSLSVEDMALQGVSREDAATLRRLLAQIYDNVTSGRTKSG